VCYNLDEIVDEGCLVEDNEYLTVEEAAREIERSVPTVWRLIRRYNLQTFRRPLDRKTYLRRSDVRQLREMFEPRTREGKAAA